MCYTPTYLVLISEQLTQNRWHSKIRIPIVPEWSQDEDQTVHDVAWQAALCTNDPYMYSLLTWHGRATSECMELQLKASALSFCVYYEHTVELAVGTITHSAKLGRQLSSGGIIGSNPLQNPAISLAATKHLPSERAIQSF